MRSTLIRFGMAFLFLASAGCASTGSGNPSQLKAYADESVLGEIPLPPAPWKRDADAGGFMYRDNGLPRIKGQWVASGAASPLPALAAGARYAGWRIATLDGERLVIRLAGRMVDYRVSAPGRLSIQAYPN
jgi:hypothetical protein